jgi:hypothetical protein
VIQVEPRQILEEGLRRELVRLIATAMHTDLSFSDMTREEVSNKLSKLGTFDSTTSAVTHRRLILIAISE